MQQDTADFKPLHSYSQDGEDMLLRALLNDAPKGFFIDIGAHHPFRHSNTAYFYELGWRGINIEPTPSAIVLFEEYRKRDVNLNIGIGPQHEKRTLYCFEDSALNTFDQQIAEHQSAPIIDQAEVDIYPLAQILEEHVPHGTVIDFMNIDVAGVDVQLLESNNWDVYKPIYLLVEDVDNTGSVDASEIYSFLNGKGYDQMGYKTPHTLIFKQKSPL